jgi:hypothetical protein
MSFLTHGNVSPSLSVKNGEMPSAQDAFGPGWDRLSLADKLHYTYSMRCTGQIRLDKVSQIPGMEQNQN